MIPFPGESLSVDSYENRVGAPIDNLAQIQLREGAAFFGTGASAVVRVFFAPNYLESDADPGEVSWVVEVAGGTGLVTLTECLGNGEPDTLLGTFPVVGGDTLVVPSSVLTLANVWNDSYGSLLIEATAGPLNIQQVKLRAFPTGGALGGWGTDLHPAWDKTGFAAQKKATRLDRDGIVNAWSSAGATDWPTGWDNTLATMPAVVAGGSDETKILVALDLLTGNVGGVSSVDLHGSSTTVPPGSGGNSIVTGEGAVVTRDAGAPDVNPAEGLVDGADYIANPYEVWGDDGVFAQADTNPVATWNPLPTVGTDDQPGSDPPPVPPLLGAIPWVPDVDGGGNLFNLWPDHAAGVPEDVAMPDVDAVLIAPSHGWFRGTAPTEPNSITSDTIWSGDYFNGFQWYYTDSITYTVAMPPYRVWQVATAPVHKLRQYHRDDGLGISPRRAYGGASRNHTGRAYGYT